MNESLIEIIRKIRNLLAVPRQLSAMNEKLGQQASAIANADQRNQQEHKIQNERLENILTQSNKAESDQSAKSERDYKVQNSIRYATWSAVIAAMIYAGITLFQWRDAHQNFVANQRAWIGINGSVRINAISLEKDGSGKISFTVPTKNFGNSVALDIAMEGEGINGYDPMDAASIETCQTATTLSNVRYLKHVRVPNPSGMPEFNLPQQISPGLMFQAESSVHSFPERLVKTSKVVLGVAVIGCIVYKDQFGKQRRTRFCYGGIGSGTITAGSLLSPCVLGINDAE